MSNRWYGSINNRLAEDCVYAGDIKVGTLCTELCYSDTHPYEIVEVKDARHVFARRLGYKVVKGSCQDGSAVYEYFQKPELTPIMLFKKKNGKWVEKFPGGGYGNVFGMGWAEEYYDPCF